MKTVAQRSVVGTPLTAPRFAPTRGRQNTRLQSHTAVSGDPAVVSAGGMLTLATALLASQPVQAAQELATVADGDNRLGAVAFLFVPAIAWVLFNIGGPASRQLDAMNAGKPKPVAPKSTPRKPPTKRKPVAKRR